MEGLLEERMAMEVSSSVVVDGEVDLTMSMVALSDDTFVFFFFFLLDVGFLAGSTEPPREFKAPKA